MKICWARPQLVFTFFNRFSSTGWAVPQSVRYRIFRLQASYLSATSHTGRKSCRVKSLYMKRFWFQPPTALGSLENEIYVFKYMPLLQKSSHSPITHSRPWIILQFFYLFLVKDFHGCGWKYISRLTTRASDLETKKFNIVLVSDSLPSSPISDAFYTNNQSDIGDHKYTRKRG
jgi:hypothetical protein